jgi:hypothetical protein
VREAQFPLLNQNLQEQHRPLVNLSGPVRMVHARHVPQISR